MKESPRYEQFTMEEAQRTAFLERVRAQVSAEDYRIIEGLSLALPEVLALIEQDPMTLRKLRHTLFGPKTEKTQRVCPAPEPSTPRPKAPRRKRKGHGRHKARDYTGARWLQVAHPRLKPGDRCPGCAKGTLRAQAKALLLRIVGSPPIAATGYAMERLRCDGCGQVFTAPPPPEAGTQKYDPSVGVTVALSLIHI